MFIKYQDDNFSKKNKKKTNNRQTENYLFFSYGSLRGGNSHLSRLVGSHEEGVTPQALWKPPAATAVRRLAT